jgi:exosortase family protein XrtG
MTWELLQLLCLIYIVGLLFLRRRKWRLAAYVWGAGGLSFLVIHLTVLMGWNEQIAWLEASHVQSIMRLFGVELRTFSNVSLMVPDPTGWTGLSITEECSSLIEFSAFLGLLLFYPRIPLTQRASFIVIGALGTYVLNLIRILIIVGMIIIYGKPIVPLAHAVVGRAVYFVGIIILYWYLLTRPTLVMVRRTIEISGQGVD